MHRLTKRIGNLDAVPGYFDLDFVFNLDDKTYKGLVAVLNRLCNYEDSDLEPDSVCQIKRASEYMMFESVGDFVRYAISNFEELQRVKKERDAAIEDLKKNRKYKCDCCYYANKQGRYIPCRDCNSPISNYGDGWKWRGLGDEKTDV